MRRAGLANTRFLAPAVLVCVLTAAPNDSAAQEINEICRGSDAYTYLHSMFVSQPFPGNNTAFFDLLHRRAGFLKRNCQVTGYALPSVGMDSVNPIAIIAGTDGNAYSTYTLKQPSGQLDGSGIFSLTQAGVFTFYALNPNACSTGICPIVEVSNSIYVGEGSIFKIAKLTPPSGAITEYGLPFGTDVFGMAPSPNGSILFTTGTGFGTLSPTGSVSLTTIPGAFTQRIAVDDRGQAYITDTNNNTIDAFDLQTDVVRKINIPTPGAFPFSIVATGGKVVFTELFADKIGLIADPANPNIVEISVPGSAQPLEITDGSGFPNALAIFNSTDGKLFSVAAGSRACSGTFTSLCLGDRFQVQTRWTTPDGQSGDGQAVSLTSDTGFFWFFSPSNVEMVTKVLNGCGVNQRFWAFAGGLTNVQVDLTVTDTQTNTVKTYRNPQGTAFQPIQDTNAFSACSGSAFLAAKPPEEGAETSASVTQKVASPENLGRKRPQAEQVCTADATTLCVGGGRFRVQTRWATPDGGSGDGRAVSLTGDTGYFWFFGSSNVEMVVKVLDACSFNGRKWVFAGGLTNVNVTMTVTDTLTGAVKTYVNPQGIAFQPIQDTGAFSTCP